MRNIPRGLALLSLIFLLSAVCMGQAPQPSPKDTSASVSGRVTIGGKPAAGITITASVTTSFMDTKIVAKNSTDEDGKYRLGIKPETAAALRPRDLAWDAAARARLRTAAEAANNIVELKPCQRLADYSLKLQPVP